MEIRGIKVDPEKYPMMDLHAKEIKPFTGKLVAKEQAVEGLLATYDDPIVSNAVLLAPPGTGKTTLMKGMAYQDKKHVYLEAELSELITGLRDNAEMGSVVKNLFNEIAEFGKENNVKIVIFVDEFHQLVDYSPVVAEAFKPVLAESGVKGLRLIVATTYEEFRQKIMPNQALTERLQRISLPQPRYEDVIHALESLAKEQKIPIDRRLRELFDVIFKVTEEYMPAANQPRKSVLTFSRMIGYHRAHRKPLSFDLLAYTLRNGQNIEIDMKVDLHAMEEHMRKNIYDQDEAIDSFMYSIALSVMKMNEENKPRGSWLMLGPTGVGKALTDDTLIPTLNQDGEFVVKRNGDLVIGDKVFNKEGKPVSILKVYPQGKRNIYKVTFEDGRVVEASDEHLWNVFTNDQVHVISTGEVVNTKYLLEHFNEDTYFVPRNKAIQLEEQEFDFDPFTIGVKLARYYSDSSEKIGDTYKEIIKGSINQRLDFISGTFHVSGFIENENDIKLKVGFIFDDFMYTSFVQQILWSLGYSTKIINYNNERFKLLLNGSSDLKYAFLNQINDFLNFDVNLDVYDDYIKIQSIEVLDEKVDMTCIYIDDVDHLYQTYNGIVTHNTELVKKASDFLFADPNAFIRFDMTEYVNADSVDRFRKLVTARMWEYPFSILLFDEIEKAHGNVVRLLMQILDDGRLVDANDRVVNFSNAYIFGTSNLGSEIFESASQYGTKSRSYDRNVKKSITETSSGGGFPPELVNRFDTIVPFNPLSRNTMIRLIFMKCQKIINRFYYEHGVKVHVDENVLYDYLGYDILEDDTEAGAGRQVNRILKKYITMPVSTYINDHRNVKVIHVVVEGKTVYGNKDIVDGTAEIKIYNHTEWVEKYGEKDL